MSAAAAVPITSAGVQPFPFIRYRPDQAKLLGRGPAKLLELLEFRAQKDGATFHCKSRWLEWKSGYSDRHVSRMLALLVKGNKLTTKMAGNGLRITVLRYAKMAEEVRQNGVPSAPPSINLQEQEKTKNSSSTAAADQAEKTKPKITELPDPEAVAELTKRGVWPSQAQKLTREFGKERVMAAIAYWEQAEGVRYTPGFLVTAIREGWKIPKSPPLPAPAMKACVACGEFFNPNLEGWYDGKCSRCQENSEGLRRPAGELHRPMEEPHRQSEDGRQSLSGQSDGTNEVQRTVRVARGIEATIRKEPQLPVDASCCSGGMESKTDTGPHRRRHLSIARGRLAALEVPKCRKCGFPIDAERLGTHGIHFACDEWSRG